MSKGLPHFSNVLDSVLDARNLDFYFISLRSITTMQNRILRKNGCKDRKIQSIVKKQ